jgi:DNA-binding transcriptional MerR regulator
MTVLTRGSVVKTTGTLARELGLSRERILQILKEMGLEPIRDSNGHRLLDKETVERLRQHREKQTKEACAP